MTAHAHRPEDLHAMFARAFGAGDLDALVALYEDDAVLVPEPGQVKRGRRMAAGPGRRSSRWRGPGEHPARRAAGRS